MKHVFECGIVGTANGPAGEEFLSRMIETEKQTDIILAPIWPCPSKEPPKDFTVKIPDCYTARMGYPELWHFNNAVQNICARMRCNGYEVTTWRDEASMSDCLTFKHP